MGGQELTSVWPDVSLLGFAKDALAPLGKVDWSLSRGGSKGHGWDSAPRDLGLEEGVESRLAR